MKTTASRFIPFFALLATFYIVIGSPVVAQKEALAMLKERGFCTSNNYGISDRPSIKDLRETTVPAGGTVTVDGGKNGGISVKGENRSDVLVRACVNTWAATDADARSIMESIKVNTAGSIRADGPEAAERSGWSVSYEVLVPRNSDLSLKAMNGGISIRSVEGSMSFETNNGGVNLADLAGDVKGRTTNGGLNVNLSGSSWKGSGLDVTTTNGGVNLSVPEGYSANFEAGTTNGGFKSEIPSLNIEQEDNLGKTNGWARSKRIRAALNGGGANIRVVTTNGGVKINAGSE